MVHTIIRSSFPNTIHCFFKDNSAIFKALFPFESDVSVGDTKYRVLKPVEDRKTSFNDPSVPESSKSIFCDLKRFRRITIWVNTVEPVYDGPVYSGHPVYNGH